MAQGNTTASKKQQTKGKPTRKKKADLTRLQMVAQMLYVDRGLEQKVIAATLDISESTISNWKTTGDWEVLREQVMVGAEQEMRRLRTMLRNHLDKLEKEKKFPDSGEADAIKKVTSAIKDLMGDDVLTMHKYVVGKNFIEFVQQTYGHAKTVEMTELWTEYLMRV